MKQLVNTTVDATVSGPAPVVIVKAVPNTVHKIISGKSSTD